MEILVSLPLQTKIIPAHFWTESCCCGSGYCHLWVEMEMKRIQFNHKGDDECENNLLRNVPQLKEQHKTAEICQVNILLHKNRKIGRKIVCWAHASKRGQYTISLLVKLYIVWSKLMESDLFVPLVCIVNWLSISVDMMWDGCDRRRGRKEVPNARSLFHPLFT